MLFSNYLNFVTPMLSFIAYQQSLYSDDSAGRVVVVFW